MVEFRNAFELTAKSASYYFPEEDLVWVLTPTLELPLFAGAGVERSSSSFAADAAFEIRRCMILKMFSEFGLHIHSFTLDENRIQSLVTYDATADGHCL